MTDGIAIEVESARLDYVPGNVPVLYGRDLDLPELDTVTAVLSSDRTRLAMIRTPFVRRPRLGRFLFWREPMDLARIDMAVRQGEVRDDDFAPSIITQFQLTECGECGVVSRTLIVVPGDVYPNAPGLLQRKVESTRFLLCPICSQGFRQMVVHVL